MIHIAWICLFFLLFLPFVFILFGSGVDFAALQAGDTSAMPELGGGTALFLALYMLVLIPIMFWLAARLSVVMPVVAQYMPSGQADAIRTDAPGHADRRHGTVVDGTVGRAPAGDGR